MAGLARRAKACMDLCFQGNLRFAPGGVKVDRVHRTTRAIIDFKAGAVGQAEGRFRLSLLFLSLAGFLYILL